MYNSSDALAAANGPRPSGSVTLTADEIDALGADAADLTTDMRVILEGIAAARRGRHMLSALIVDAVLSLSARMEGLLDAAIRQRVNEGASHADIAELLGRSRSGAQYVKEQLALGPSAGELWVTGQRGDMDNPNYVVQGRLRDWHNPYPGYLPVDVTPDTPHREAEPAASPDQISRDEWQNRQNRATVPFELDSRWWPLNPSGRTGRTGRALRRWGENAAADPVVITGTGRDRQVLLIRRADTGEWATPGGHVDPGEDPLATLPRELREETGVDLSDYTPRVIDRTYVNDRRCTDHAWIATTLAVYEVPEPIEPTPDPRECLDAAWLPFGSLVALIVDLHNRGQKLSSPHRELLLTVAETLGQVDSPSAWQVKYAMPDGSEQHVTLTTRHERKAIAEAERLQREIPRCVTHVTPIYPGDDTDELN